MSAVIERLILERLRAEEQIAPPSDRYAQEVFWLAASRLQARGLAVADQFAGVVRMAS